MKLDDLMENVKKGRLDYSSAIEEIFGDSYRDNSIEACIQLGEMAVEEKNRGAVCAVYPMIKMLKVEGFTSPGDLKRIAPVKTFYDDYLQEVKERAKNSGYSS
jgi:hypothetical protein